MIRLRDVAFAYGDGPDAFAIRVPGLAVERGERIACIGLSGSGKSTLMNIIAGILLPSAGEVVVLGEDLASLSDRQRRRLRLSRIGMVFQEFELLEYLSARENILLARLLEQGLDEAALRRRADELAAAAGITHVLRRKPAALSHGERQRVAICRALATGPELVLCDEPTGSLDPHSAGAVLDLLFDQARLRGATLVMVTHDHALLDRFDRVVDLRETAHAFSGPAAAIRVTRPASPPVGRP